MKPKYLLFALTAVITLWITACEKDSDDTINPQEEPNEEFVMPTGEAAKILGKWQINSITVNNHRSGVDHKETYTGTATDYVDFKTDGKLHTFAKGALDISNYTVRSAREITIDGDPASVQTLTETRLVLYSQDKTGTFGYTEITYDLKR